MRTRPPDRARGDAPESRAARIAVRLVFAAVVVAFVIQQRVPEDFGEPYPALIMPSGRKNRCSIASAKGLFAAAPNISLAASKAMF